MEGKLLSTCGNCLDIVISSGNYEIDWLLVGHAADAVKKTRFVAAGDQIIAVGAGLLEEEEVVVTADYGERPIARSETANEVIARAGTCL